MKKAIAILLLMLINLVSVSGAVQMPGTGIEQAMECEDKKHDGKDSKKEWKEYTLGNTHKLGQLFYVYQTLSLYIAPTLPQPLIDQPALPPNKAC